MIPVKYALIAIGIVLIYLLIVRKMQGKKGTWDSRSEIEEFATLMATTTNTTAAVPNAVVVVPDAPGRKLAPMSSVGEQICRSYLTAKFGTEFKRSRPAFLKNPITNNNLELDCYSDALKLAVEYNGRQHYEFVPVFHRTKSDFQNQKYRDDIKRRLCAQNGVKLIEVPYTVAHSDIPKYLDQRV